MHPRSERVDQKMKQPTGKGSTPPSGLSTKEVLSTVNHTDHL